MRAKFLIAFGILFILWTLGLAYYTFFVPKVGPIGNGPFNWTNYKQFMLSFIIGIGALFRGVYAIRHKKN